MDDRLYLYINRFLLMLMETFSFTQNRPIIGVHPERMHKLCGVMRGQGEESEDFDNGKS